MATLKCLHGMLANITSEVVERTSWVRLSSWPEIPASTAAGQGSHTFAEGAHDKATLHFVNQDPQIWL